MPRKLKPIEYVIDNNGCHVCTSHYKNRAGYPVFRRGGKFWLMSRYYYTQKYGEIPNYMCVRHKCDNPNCINIEHFEIGTIADNNLDKMQRGRFRPNKGIFNGRCKLKEIEVIEIYFSQIPYKELSKKYKIEYTSVYDIKNGRTWKHITSNLSK